MTGSDHKDVFKRLRQAYPVFVYRDFDIKHTEGNTSVGFSFDAGDQYSFHPRWQIHYGNWHKNLVANPSKAEGWGFQLGMIEMVSYWKAFCSPYIETWCGALSEDQRAWWFKLYQHGLGEFFYTNGIDIPGDDMLEFITNHPDTDQHSPGSSEPAADRLKVYPPPESVLVPVGGGKDSVVTLELLKRAGYQLIPFVINPRGATAGVLSQAGFPSGEIITMDRQMDPLLLELNKRGFLNGHTPFSAMLAFASSFVATRVGVKHVALSNESSANEPSVPGTMINHQYSKSLAFEKDFRSYAYQYLDEHINYFSLLRPLNELQIGALFSGFTDHHHVFRSCNAGSKQNRWCGKCAKCLFTYVILSPFLPQHYLQEIFGANLFRDTELRSMLFDLCGDGRNKPFECVGTTDEVNTAVVYIIKHMEVKGEKLPDLLQAYRHSHLYEKYQHQDIKEHLQHFDDDHCLDARFETMVKEALEGLDKRLIR